VTATESAPGATAALDDCGCCQVALPEPVVTNRPGLSALVYRIGTHGAFMRRMLADLPGAPYPRDPADPTRPLRSLTTRSPDDPAIALLDVWATAADVLTFYQERIANEGFLRTATELRSVLELARAIGYELSPGVAASAYLAFTVETAAGAPLRAVVPLGTKVKSIPGQNEKPQTFETIEEIEAHVEWNGMRPRLFVPQVLAQGTKKAYLRGTATQLQPGDAILIVGDERAKLNWSEQWDFRILQTVTAYPSDDPTRQGYTVIEWEIGLGLDRETRVKPVKKNVPVQPAEENIKVYAFRQRAALFGYNAPDWRTMPKEVKQAYRSDIDIADPDINLDDPKTYGSQWPGFEITSRRGAVIDLDVPYPRVRPGSWIALLKPGYVEIYAAAEVSIASRADFALTGKTTRIVPDTREHLSWFDLRSTVVFGQSEELGLADIPVKDSPDYEVLAGKEVIIVPAVSGLQKGQAITVSGRPPGASSDVEAISEVAFIDLVVEGESDTTITLSDPLSNSYDPTTVTVSANVAPATHGESVVEKLGGGSGAATFQRFDLKKPPLTYVSATTATGSKDTLSVRVDGVEWSEAASLYGLDARSQSYVLRRDDKQKPTVIFGDGQSGARLPSGQENVSATYRSGIGPEGNVKAGSLTLLQIRPFGIRSVINPLPASGGESAEQLDMARVNAPFTVLTLDRIVSLQDFEDFARAFAGIAKAQATAIWNGTKYLVHVTVAGPNGAAVSSTSATYLDLRSAADARRDPAQILLLDTYRPLSFRLTGNVMVDPRYVAADVLAGVQTALLASFAFDSRAFGQPVTAAEVVTVMQSVKGVVASSLEALYSVDPDATPGSTPPSLQEFLPAERASLDEGAFKPTPAQLLLIDALGATIGEMVS
jgi:molybdopterin converting factor small subunit